MRSNGLASDKDVDMGDASDDKALVEVSRIRGHMEQLKANVLSKMHENRDNDREHFSRVYEQFTKESDKRYKALEKDVIREFSNFEGLLKD